MVRREQNLTTVRRRTSNEVRREPCCQNKLGGNGHLPSTRGALPESFCAHFIEEIFYRGTQFAKAWAGSEATFANFRVRSSIKSLVKHVASTS